MRPTTSCTFTPTLIALTIIAIACLPRVASSAEPAGWLDDFAAASERAGKEQRAMLLNFTGTDWCVWCHRLRDEVFVQSSFLDYAQSALVLVEVDFPRRTVLAPATAKQNKALAERFGVTGYPTILLLDSSGREIGRLSYMQGGAKTFVRELKRLIAAAHEKGAATAAAP